MCNRRHHHPKVPPSATSSTFFPSVTRNHIMNSDVIMGATTTATSSDLQLCPASPDTQEILRRTTLDTSDVSVGHIQPITTIKPHQQNPRKKRTKMIRFHNSKSAIVGVAGSSSSHSATHSSGIITKKKPDPSAPKITRPCTECGKRFWSWKALFGHMRCHPERPWRGINPPPNLHHNNHPPPDHQDDFTNVTTEEDEYVAACLLTLANTTPTPTPTTSTSHHHHFQDTDPETRFECSSCKKVFGSHQALGGHRASHKNVKGCFAITRNDELEDGEFEGVMINLGSGQQHRCSICSRIFSSGQALGGHKRRHWEKEDTTATTTATTTPPSTPFRFDLNSPPPHDSTSDLDLRLAL